MNTTMNVLRTSAAAMLAVAVTLASGNGVSHAAPEADATDTASCTYTLTPPSVTTVSGTTMVTASLTPGPCNGNISMNSLTVCVELQGYSPPECSFQPMWDPVRVFFAPYRSGATYIATGRGCGNLHPSGVELCASVGPYRQTL